MAKSVNTISEKLTAFRVYSDSNDYLGIATVDLPEITAMSDTVSGAGIAGEVETPVIGHYQSMTVTLHWRVIEGDISGLSSPKSHNLEIRGSQQRYDASTGTYSTQPVKMVIRGTPKSISLGSFEPGSSTDTTTELEITYLKITVGGEDFCEIDKYNYIASFGGSDTLDSVRNDLGIA